MSSSRKQVAFGAGSKDGTNTTGSGVPTVHTLKPPSEAGPLGYANEFESGEELADDISNDYNSGDGFSSDRTVSNKTDDGGGLNMEFTRWREAVVVVCFIFYISDLLLDAWVLRTFVVAEQIQQAWFMGFCMLIPNLYAGYKSLQWYLRAFRDQPHPVTDPKVWLIRVLFFPISLVLRYYDVLRRGYKARAAAASGERARQRIAMEHFVSESSEVAMLRLFVIFLEDAPICVLNLMLVFATSPENIDNVGYSVGVVVAKLSCSITLGVVHYASVTKVAWHACNYTSGLVNAGEQHYNSDKNIVTTRASRRGPRNKDLEPKKTEQEFQRRANISPLAHLLLYLWQFCTIGSRLVCYALFASVFQVWVLLLAAIRWLINTICILVDVPNMSLANCASFGGVYLFTFVSTSTDQQYIRIALYYLVNSIEAIAVAVVWWTREMENPYHVLGFALLIAGTASGVIFMSIYYACGHPNRQNTWGWLVYREYRDDGTRYVTDVPAEERY